MIGIEKNLEGDWFDKAAVLCTSICNIFGVVNKAAAPRSICSYLERLVI